MRKCKFYLISILIICGFLILPDSVKADWADCYVQKQSDSKVSVGETFTYELGTAGFTYGTKVYGVHYELQYDPDVLEPIIEKNVGVASYYNWENISTKIIKSDIFSYNTLVIDMYTNNTNNYVENDSNGFTKLGFVKFKVKNTNETSTKISLVQTYEEDLVNGQFSGSNSSFKYVYDYANEQKNIQEPCYTTISTYVSIYKKAYLSSITVNNTTIKNFDSNTYTYNIESVEKEININASVENGYIIAGDIGKKSLNNGNNSFVIKVTSPTGDIKNYTLNVNYATKNSKSATNTLKTLTLSAGEIKFSSDINNYNVEVENDVDKIKINSTLMDEKSSYIDNYGNREIELKEGINEVLIMVKAENDSVNTYTLLITRKEKNNTPGIKKIEISDYSLNFSEEKTNYTLRINPETSKLDFLIELYNDETKYDISGNENLKDGSVITITVTSIDGDIPKKYYINIVKENDEINELGNNKTIIFLIILCSVLFVGIIIVSYIAIKNKKS